MLHHLGLRDPVFQFGKQPMGSNGLPPLKEVTTIPLEDKEGGIVKNKSSDILRTPSEQSKKEKL